MNDYLKGFMKFIMRGNILELAVAVIIGVAFGAVVLAFTDGVLMAFIAAVVGEPSFDAITVDIGDGTIQIGSFLTALANFLIIAFAVYGVVQVVERSKPVDVDEEEAGPTDSDRLASIDQSLQVLADRTNR